MIDIGVNLTNPRFANEHSALIERSMTAGIEHWLITGTSETTSKQALELCQQYPQYLSATAGVHPHDADQASSDFITILSQLAHSPFVKAIGECGLDFNRNFSTPSNQKRIFDAQITLAAEFNMPLFLHQRDAFRPWLEMLTPYIDKVPAMVSHCFTSNLDELKICLDVGMYIGITGWLCDKRRGQELRDIVKYIPIERLLIETDAPYLTPQNIKPKPKSSRNEPAYLTYIVQQLAELTPYNKQEIMAYTNNNARRVFNIL